MRNKVVIVIILFCFLFLFSSGANAARAPIHQAKSCFLSGGFYSQHSCWCPPFTNNDRGSCFIRTYKESCKNMGGKVKIGKTREPYPLRQCIKNGKEINPDPIPALFLWWFLPVAGGIVYFLRKRSLLFLFVGKS